MVLKWLHYEGLAVAKSGLCMFLERRIMKFARLPVALCLVALLAACGGGDEITNNYHTTPETQPPAAVIDDVVTLVVASDSVSVNAGTGYELIINVTCSVDSQTGTCLKPAVVKDITPAVGTLSHVSYDLGGNTINVWPLTESEVFVPNGSLVFDRPMQLIAHFTVNPAATPGTVPQKLSVTTTYGTVEVVRAPLVTIANGPIEVKDVSPADFGGGDGTSREVAAFTLVCPIDVTCRVPRSFSSNWKSTVGAQVADVMIEYQYNGVGHGNGRQIQFISNDDWVWFDLSWTDEFTFTGELRVSISTTLPAGQVRVYPSLPIMDELGRPLYLNTAQHALLGG